MADIPVYHSPAPWYAIQHGRGSLAWRVTMTPDDARGDVANVIGYHARHVEANAALIAAAPDLLAALQGVLRVADRATDEFDAARAAIAKATTPDDRGATA